MQSWPLNIAASWWLLSDEFVLYPNIILLSCAAEGPGNPILGHTTVLLSFELSRIWCTRLAEGLYGVQVDNTRRGLDLESYVLHNR